MKLCAPTGRAAQKLSESVGVEATTIHRLLEYRFTGVGKKAKGEEEEGEEKGREKRAEKDLKGNPKEKWGTHFERNEDNELEVNRALMHRMAYCEEGRS